MNDKIVKSKATKHSTLKRRNYIAPKEQVGTKPTKMVLKRPSLVTRKKQYILM